MKSKRPHVSAFDGNNNDRPRFFGARLDDDPHKACLLWSQEHGAFWKVGDAGYTTDIIQAAGYTYEEAVERLVDANRFGDIASEVLIPSPFLFINMDKKLAAAETANAELQETLDTVMKDLSEALEELKGLRKLFYGKKDA